ncbi:hypothetical protein Godav_015008 [Gossypium davidsonii]|uniref:RNase H type-1 domain-containing protein n=1 Tax=Gossypium davidsonii TaxID=34287 RepID=A0A7J8RN29_GOSDV|nr:hypothetical protein [Gossypium davidsonii]
MGSCIVNNMEKVNGDWLLSAPIKNETVEQVVENKLNNYRKKLINSGDLHLNTTSHFNPTFEGPVELGISLNPNLLDPSKHTTMVFKDNHGDNTTISLEGGDLGISDIGVPTVVVPKLGNWIQLNSNEAVKEESGFVMIGGVLRDRYDGWIIGYNRSMGICSVLDFELWGTLEGLSIAMYWGFDRVLIVSDSHEAVQAIQGSATKVSNSALVRRINLRMAKLMEWSILHISRDFNKEVDSLAKMDVDNKGRT